MAEVAVAAKGVDGVVGNKHNRTMLAFINIFNPINPFNIVIFGVVMIVFWSSNPNFPDPLRWFFPTVPNVVLPGEAYGQSGWTAFKMSFFYSFLIYAVISFFFFRFILGGFAKITHKAAELPVVP